MLGYKVKLEIVACMYMNVYRSAKMAIDKDSHDSQRPPMSHLHLINSSLNEARVYQRTKEGGHDVPAEKIHSRIPRTMENIKSALSIVDEARILDNSSEKDRFKQVVVMKSGKYEMKVDPIPSWLNKILPFDLDIGI